MFVMVDCVRKMTVKKSCKCGNMDRYGAFVCVGVVVFFVVIFFYSHFQYCGMTQTSISVHCSHQLAAVSALGFLGCK